MSCIITDHDAAHVSPFSGPMRARAVAPQRGKKSQQKRRLT